uniref:Uncharacterized protein n=1 Tax=Romanomermis culicivorax TaxID=13658 RepID=A0A915KLT7_ROMCU
MFDMLKKHMVQYDHSGALGHTTVKDDCSRPKQKRGLNLSQTFCQCNPGRCEPSDNFELKMIHSYESLCKTNEFTLSTFGALLQSHIGWQDAPVISSRITLPIPSMTLNRASYDFNNHYNLLPSSGEAFSMSTFTYHIDQHLNFLNLAFVPLLSKYSTDIHLHRPIFIAFLRFFASEKIMDKVGLRTPLENPASNYN